MLWVSRGQIKRRNGMANGFHGVFPAMLTPMTPAEDVDFPKLEALTEYLIDAGVHGLVPLGTTGKFYSLSPPERHDVLKTVIRAAAGRVPVVAGVNAGATCEVVQYSREAEALGAAGILVAPPYYSLPRPTSCWSICGWSIGPSVSRSCSTIFPPARASI